LVADALAQWIGEEKLVALIQESLAVATRTGAAKPADFSKVIVDTTVQHKAVAFPTDARPLVSKSAYDLNVDIGK
jgi:hypothetical protein